MLIGIPKLISPELMRILMEMGHGDELVIADANFPAYAIARSTASGEVARLDGAGCAQALNALLALLPIDYAVESPIIGMSAPDGEAPIHAAFKDVLASRGYGAEKLAFLPRFDFYARARSAYAVLATGETERFANLIIKKGVVVSNDRRGEM